MRATQVAIDRMKKAREEKELVQKLKESGVHRNERSVSKLRLKSPYKGIDSNQISNFQQQSVISEITNIKQLASNDSFVN